MANKLGYGKSGMSPVPKVRKAYHVKGVSSRIWRDEESSGNASTRQRLKNALRRDLDEALNGKDDHADDSRIP